jgi:hypothetical protein
MSVRESCVVSIASDPRFRLPTFKPSVETGWRMLRGEHRNLPRHAEEVENLKVVRDALLFVIDGRVCPVCDGEKGKYLPFCQVCRTHISYMDYRQLLEESRSQGDKLVFAVLYDRAIDMATVEVKEGELPFWVPNGSKGKTKRIHKKGEEDLYGDGE